MAKIYKKINFCLAISISLSNCWAGQKLEWPWEDETALKSSYPFITGVTLREYCDHKYDPVSNIDPEKINRGDVVFVVNNYLEDFFKKYHPRIRNSYSMLTANVYGNGDGDNPMPGRFSEYLDDAKIAVWFAANIDRKHTKLYGVPLGIAPAFYIFGDIDVIGKVILKSKNVPKTKLLYMNFNLHSETATWTESTQFIVERNGVHELFASRSWVTDMCFDEKWGVLKNVSMDEYFEQMLQHKFVLSPRGRGLDCYRTWEALLVGCYPVVKSSTLDPIFEDLPVVIVNDWVEVTEEFLEKKYQEMSRRTYNLEKLYMPYWLNKLREV